MPDLVRLFRHTESYEVRLPNGERKFWYFDDRDPIRRTLMGRTTSEEAEKLARAYAEIKREEIEGQ